MTESMTYECRKLDDASVLSLLEKLLDLKREDSQLSFSYIPGVEVNRNEVEKDGHLVGRYAIQMAKLELKSTIDTSVIISFRRFKSENSVRVVSQKNDFMDVYYSPSISAWQGVEEKKIISKISSILGEVTGRFVSSDDGGQIEILNSLLNDFSDTHRQMLSDLNQKVMDLEVRRVELETDHTQREIERQASHEKELQDLQAKRDDLARHSHMSARRKTLQSLNERTREEVRRSLTPPGAVLTRWCVFAAALLLSAAAGTFSFESLKLFGSTDAGLQSPLVQFALLAKAFIASVICLSALAYAAAWLRGFYNSDIAASREIERFNYDLSRASWIIEAVLEVQHENKGEIPDVWIREVSKNLFSGSTARQSGDESGQALAALLGYTASASFGPDGPKFELGRRGARRLARDANKFEEDEQSN